MISSRSATCDIHREPPRRRFPRPRKAAVLYFKRISWRCDHYEDEPGAEAFISGEMVKWLLGQ